MTTQLTSNVSKIKDQYDLFLVDLWGVVHDGESLYDGVMDCLTQLKNSNKKVIFISNAPKKTEVAAQGLEAMGVTRDLYDHVVTSGEITYEYITANQHDLGSNYFLINEQEVNLMDDSGYQSVETPEEADFVLSIGFERPDSTLEELVPTLYDCRLNDLPMICANPDLVIISKKGVSWLCAGTMAAKYTELGGEVTYFGKPFQHIYDKALSYVPDIDKNRVAAIGDNIRTDIQGGNNFGINTYLIPGGIHGGEISVDHGSLPNEDRLKQFFDIHNTTPTGVLPAFVWE